MLAELSFSKRMAHYYLVEPFDPATEQIEDYKERFDFYCTAHGIMEDKQKALFLTRIGQKIYAKMKTWVSPTSFSDLSFHEIVEKLKVCLIKKQQKLLNDIGSPRDSSSQTSLLLIICQSYTN